MSIKQPVPVVSLMSPLFQHLFAKAEADWSATRAPIGKEAPNIPSSTLQYSSHVSLMSGRMPSGKDKRLHNIADHVIVNGSNRTVDDALEKSVMCILPFVNFQTSQVSIVPKQRSFSFASFEIFGMFLKTQCKRIAAC